MRNMAVLRHQGERGTQLRGALRGWATATHALSCPTGASRAWLFFAVGPQLVPLAAWLGSVLPCACAEPAEEASTWAQICVIQSRPLAEAQKAGGRELPFWLLCNWSWCGEGSGVGLVRATPSGRRGVSVSGSSEPPVPPRARKVHQGSGQMNPCAVVTAF